MIVVAKKYLCVATVQMSSSTVFLIVFLKDFTLITLVNFRPTSVFDSLFCWYVWIQLFKEMSMSKQLHL